MSLEKRLPLALLLSFVAVFGFSYLNAPKGPTGPGVDGAPEGVAADAAGATPETGTAAGSPRTPAAEGAGDASPAAAEREASATAAVEAASAVEDLASAPAGAIAGAPADGAAAAEPWSDWLELGSEGERGHYFAHFSSEGGSLLELRTGSYWLERGLTEAEKGELENRVPILRPVRYAEPDGTTRTKGSLTLRPGPSARDVVPEDLERLHWDHEVLRAADGRVEGVRFWHDAPGGIRLEKTIRREPGQYHLLVTLGITNVSADRPARIAGFQLTAVEATPPLGADRFYVEPKAVAARGGRDPKEHQRDFKAKRRDGQLVGGDVAYLGAHNKYFAALLRPADAVAQQALREASWRAVFDGEWAAKAGNSPAEGFRYVAADAQLELVIPAMGDARALEFVLYAGPKDRDAFGPGDEAFGDLIQADLGFFDGIAGVILRFLRFLQGIFGNWGISIIVLTLCVRALLFPLNRRMQTSMARHATKMKRIQPRIDAVKEKYKDDPKKLREEQAKIIQTEGAIPPLGGCLPVFLQIPIFFGLFSALKVAFDLRQQPFVGWINDLAQPDRMMELGIGNVLFIDLTYLNILPVLMVVLWIAQQSVMPKPTDPQAAQMHKLMKWMPIMFGVFLYDYAAGLSLYMITTSLFGIAEFTIIRRIWPLDEKEQPKKQGGFLAKLSKMQEQAQRMQEQQQRTKAQGAKSAKSPKGGGKRR